MFGEDANAKSEETMTFSLTWLPFQGDDQLVEPKGNKLFRPKTLPIVLRKAFAEIIRNRGPFFAALDSNVHTKNILECLKGWVNGLRHFFASEYPGIVR